MRRDPWEGTPYRPPTTSDTVRAIGKSIAIAALDVANEAIDAGYRSAVGTVLGRVEMAAGRLRDAVSRARERNGR
jgi:hypothetical protein